MPSAFVDGRWWIVIMVVLDLRGLVFESPVRSGYLVPRGSN
jgi:hypothetical protein